MVSYSDHGYNYNVVIHYPPYRRRYSASSLTVLSEWSAYLYLHHYDNATLYFQATVIFSMRTWTTIAIQFHALHLTISISRKPR